MNAVQAQETDFDYTEDAGVATGGVTLDQLAALAQRQLDAEVALAEAMALVEERKAQLAAISERELPAALDALNLKDFKTLTGLTIEVKEDIRASVPKDKMPAACAWLREHNSAGIIKRGITVQFAAGEDEKAQRLITALAKKGLEPEDKTSIHPSTLSAFVREKLEAGQQIPMDTFGVFRDRYTVVKTPKEKKPK